LPPSSIGIEWPKTILPEGTALYESGVEKLKSDRARWARLPYAVDAIPAVRAVLAAEDRRDDVVPVAATCACRPSTAASTPRRDSGQSEARRLRRALLPAARRADPGSRERAAEHRRRPAVPDNAERAGIVNARLPASKAEVTVRTKVAHSGSGSPGRSCRSRYADVNDYDVADAIGRR
jgi:hypothetical protein